MLKQLAFITLILSSCAGNPFAKDNEDKGSVASLQDKVRAKRSFYLQESEKLSASLPYGWPEDTGDGMLFTCLYRAAGGTSDFTLAIAPDGRPMRNPHDAPGSKAPWSKDMETGFAWCIYSHPDKAAALAILEQHIEYGRDNNWDMCGDADVDTATRLSRCKMSGGLQRIMYLLLKHLDGSCDSKCAVEIANPLNFELPFDPEDFGRHLGVLTRELRGRLTDLNDLQLDALAKAAAEEPRNALYQCVYRRFKDGDTTKAAELLLDESMFPADRLPTKANHCTPYLYQRDEVTERDYTADAAGCIGTDPDQGLYDPATKAPRTECDLEPGKSYSRTTYNDDWLPCGDSEPRVPVDWLFAARCVLGE